MKLHEENRKREAAGAAPAEILARLPLDPLSAHDVPPGRAHEDICAEKRSNLDRMLGLAAEFQGASRALVECSANLAMLCQHNLFRGGPDSLHSSDHLAGVAENAARSFDAISGPCEEIRTADGEPLHPRAIAVALACLHDSVEDFAFSFEKGMPAAKRAPFVEAACALLQERLAGPVGAGAASMLLAHVQALSISNDDEFPESSYIAGIMQSRYTRSVKLSDIDHNLGSFPDYRPSYPAAVLPAQYQALMAGTPFEGPFRGKLLACLDRIEPAADARFAATLEELLRYEGAEGLQRLRSFYGDLRERVGRGELDEDISQFAIDRGAMERKLRELAELRVAR